MPRISQEVEIERRNNLIDIAQNLFLENGYDNVTINQIVKSLSLAKGTFYYHFRSKEDILVAVSEKLLSDTEVGIKMIHSHSNKGIYLRLKEMIDLINKDIYRNEKIWKFVYQENNILLYNQLIKTCMEKFGPLIADVLEEGTEKGLLKIPHATEMADALISLLDLYAKRTCCEYDHSIRKRTQVTIKHILELILDKECVPELGGIK